MNTTPPLLSVRLREETTEAHRRAESSHFVRQLFSGTLPRAGWVYFLHNLAALYDALEGALEAQPAHPVLAPLRLPALYRGAALRRDAEYFSDAHVTPTAFPTPTDEGVAYAAHLRALAAQRPALLVAHAYTRYLGDLSGGQAMRRALQRAFRLPEDGAGVAFFDFPQVSDHTAMKQRYRALLDELPLEPVEADAVVVEAGEAFTWSARIMHDALRASAAAPTPGPETEPA